MNVDMQARGLAASRPTMPTTASESPRTPWVAVAGAKGGVGKTTLAVNLAILFARSGRRTLLVDLDPGCGNVAVHLRLPFPRDLENVVAGECEARAAIVDGPAGIRVVASRSGSTALTGGDPALLQRTLAAITDIAKDFDVVVCDTGAGIGPVTIAAVERADVVLGVTTTDAAALTDAYSLCKVLHLRGQRLPRLVVNRTKTRDDAMRTATKLGAVVQKFLGTESLLCGWVTEDTRVEASIADQRPVALFGQGPGLDDLRALAANVLSALPQGSRTARTTTAARSVAS